MRPKPVPKGRIRTCFGCESLAAGVGGNNTQTFVRTFCTELQKEILDPVVAGRLCQMRRPVKTEGKR